MMSRAVFRVKGLEGTASTPGSMHFVFTVNVCPKPIKEKEHANPIAIYGSDFVNASSRI